MKALEGLRSNFEKVHEITNLQAELRLGRIKTIEQGKALLTPDQRKKLAALLEEPRRDLFVVRIREV